jgi:SAM-dependent methyltransferase
LYANRARALLPLAALSLAIALGHPVVAAALALLGTHTLWRTHQLYGPGSAALIARALDHARVPDDARIADLHIGTWRYARAALAARPHARVTSVDCWPMAGEEPEANLRQLRALEATPSGEPFATLETNSGRVPLPDAAFDAVLLGLGVHEFPPERLEHLLDEARRVLRPGGTLVLFEHSTDARSRLAFGPVAAHWIEPGRWLRLLEPRFADVRHARDVGAPADLFAAHKEG